MLWLWYRMVFFSFRVLVSFDLVLCSHSLLLQVLQQGSSRAPWASCISCCGTHLHSPGTHRSLCGTDILYIKRGMNLRLLEMRTQALIFTALATIHRSLWHRSSETQSEENAVAGPGIQKELVILVIVAYLCNHPFMYHYIKLLI